MKHLYVLIIIFFSHIVLTQNNVRLISRNGTPFTVHVADKPLSAAAQSEFVITGVLQDTLKLKIGFGASKYGLTLLLLEKGKRTSNKELNYLVTLEKNRVVPKFLGYKELLPAPAPLVPATYRPDSSPVKTGDARGLYELREGRPVFQNNIPSTGKCKVPMPHRYLELTTQLVLKAQIADEKMKIVEQVIRNNCFDTHQLRELLGFIEFEIEKLKMAKLAYAHLTNPQHADHLLSVFRFSASRSDLSRFLASPQNRQNNGCLVPGDSTDMAVLQQNLNMFANDSQKLNELKKNYRLLCYDIGQIQKLLSGFTHDREKLEALRLLYPYCSEPANYPALSQLLSNEESRTQFSIFLSKQQQ